MKKENVKKENVKKVYLKNKETKKERDKRLKGVFTLQELSDFDDIKANRLDTVHTASAFKAARVEGESPEFFYDEKHHMLYKRMDDNNYKHVA